MNLPDPVESNPSTLARLLMAGIDSSDTWLPSDSPGVLRALLHTSVQMLGIRVAKGEPLELRLLFEMPEPPPGLVRDVKDYAKSMLATAEPSIPRPVAGVLYYACAALARRKRLAGVTALDDAAFRQGLDWCAGQQWLAPELRQQVGLGREAVG